MWPDRARDLQHFCYDLYQNLFRTIVENAEDPNEEDDHLGPLYCANVPSPQGIAYTDEALHSEGCYGHGGPEKTDHLPN